MAKREWGAKHTCANCGAKFYDLHRNPIACPKCGSVIEIETVRPHRRRPPARPEPVPQPGRGAAAPAEEAEGAPADDDEMIDDELSDDDEGDDLAADLDDADPPAPAT